MKNIGKTDSIIRIVLGTIIIAIGLFYGSWWGLLGLIPLATTAFGVCPLYLPFGISTRK